MSEDITKKSKLNRLRKRFSTIFRASPSSSSSSSSSPSFYSQPSFETHAQLVKAIREGDYETAKEIINREGPSINFSVPNNNYNIYTNPLTEAIIYGNLEIVKLLIKKGVSVSNKIEALSKTPLFVAVEREKMEIMKFLVSQGASLNGAEAHYVLFSGELFKNITTNYIVTWLMDNGGIQISPDIFIYAIEKQPSEVVEMLAVRGKADLNNFTTLPLSTAMKKGRKEIAELLLRLGARLESKSLNNEHNSNNGYLPDNNNNNTNYSIHDANAFHGAVSNNWKDVVVTMINNGSNVNSLAYINSPERVPTSPLYIAIQMGYYDIALILIANGADVSKRLDNMLNAPTLLHMVCRRIGKLLGSIDMANLLIDKGADVNAPWIVPNIRREYPLHTAIKSDYVDMVYLLISAGADLNVEFLADGKENTVWEMCENKSVEMKRALAHVWDPSTHKFFSKKTKQSILCVLLLAKRQQWAFDKTVLYKIISHVAAPVSTVVKSQS